MRNGVRICKNYCYVNENATRFEKVEKLYDVTHCLLL